MKMFEYQVKEIFRRYGIPTPSGIVLKEAEDEKLKDLDYPVVVKSQVLTGGRSKAGGIKFAENLEEAKKKVKEVLGMEIKSCKVELVLVERKLEVNREFYVGITINRSTGTPTVIASASGGVDIEEVATKSPEKVVKLNVDLIMGLQEYEANYLMKKIGLTGKNMLTASRIMQKLYKVFRSYDAELTEINPLVLTAIGELVAADGRLNIDDSAVYRHPEFKEQEDRELTELERRAKDADLSYLELDGEIGIIGNGAGLVMATLDSVKLHGGSPANFCDLGGGAPRERVIEGIDILLTNPKVKAVLINIMGGITRCDDVATGLVEYRDRKGITIPIVCRMVGTNEKKSREICKRAGICLLDTMDEAVEKVVEFVRGS